MLAKIVEVAARMNDLRRGPHLCRHSRIFTPRRRRGVASCMLSNCNNLAPDDPPLGKTPIEPSKNAMAMAVTGGPRSFPMEVVFPILWDRVAVVHRTAIFPHVSCFDMRGRDIGKLSDGGAAASSNDVDLSIRILCLLLHGRTEAGRA